MLADCAGATKTIYLEQFIFSNDDLGKRLIEICAERAAAGVKVRFLWDAAGSFSFVGSTIAEELKNKGIELVFWKTLLPGYFKLTDFRSWYLRNHRRTLVIDGTIGYTGSISVKDSMLEWRDTNVRLEGPVVREMTNAFDRMWKRAKKERSLPRRVRAKDPEFRYITNYPAPGRRHIYGELVKAIKKAEDYVYITTPYFVPTHRLLKAIREAAHRGIDVRIILPEKTDHYPTLDYAARSYFSSLLQSGVQIYLYQGQIIHSKAVLIDGNWATVGSMNMDNASLLYNYEANIVSTNREFVDQLRDHFRMDLEHTEEVSPEEWKKRFFTEKIMAFLTRLISKFL